MSKRLVICLCLVAALAGCGQPGTSASPGAPAPSSVIPGGTTRSESPPPGDTPGPTGSPLQSGSGGAFPSAAASQ